MKVQKMLSAVNLFAALFSGITCDFDSPVKVAYDFSENKELEAMVIARNEATPSEEIASADIPSISEVKVQR